MSINHCDYFFASISRSSFYKILALRLNKELEIAFPKNEFDPQTQEKIWLRWPIHNQQLLSAVQSIFQIEIYRCYPSSETILLIPYGKSLPVMELKIESWLSLLEYSKPSALPFKMPGLYYKKIDITLEPTDYVQQSNMLRVSITQLYNWANHISVSRMKPLSYCLNDSAMVWVKGLPLPAIKDAEYGVLTNDILILAGWQWIPYVPPSVLKRLYQLNDQDILVLDPKTSPQIIKKTDFTPVSRSSIKASKG